MILKILLISLFIFNILFLIPIVSAKIVINEVMYNPSQPDYYNEFIELYNDGSNSENLTNYILCDDNLLLGYVNHNDSKIYSNTSFILPANSYALITDGGSGTDVYSNFNVDQNSIALHTTPSSLCGGLNNNGGLIILKNITTIIDAINYGDWVSEGKSLCKIPDSTGQWKECSATPGYSNSQVNRYDFSGIKINEFLPDPYGNDDAAMPNGEWTELHNEGENNIDLNGLFLKDDFGHTLYITNTTTNGTTIATNSFLVVYTNGLFGFLNNEGFERIRLYSQENYLIDEVTYSGSREGESWAKVSGIWQQTMPTPGYENIAQQLVSEPKLKIKKIYLGIDNKSKFGDNLRVLVNIYKGNSTKESVQLWAESSDQEEISKRTRVNIEEKYSNETLTLPVQLYPNCDYKHKNGTYTMVIEGLDKEDRMDFEIGGITGSLCETVIKEDSKEIDFEILELPVEAKINQDVITKIKIINSESKKIEYKLWSYIYEGSDCLSCSGKGWDENIQKIDLISGSSAIVELKNRVTEDAESGDYKFKINILKEGRKTTKEMISSIFVNNEFFKEFKTERNINNTLPISTGFVYTSKATKSKRYALYFLSAILILLIIDLLRRK